MSLVRTEPDKARSLLIDFSNYYRQTLSDSDTLTTLEHEVEQGTRYINLMQARYGDGRLRVSVDIDFEVRDCKARSSTRAVSSSWRSSSKLASCVEMRSAKGRMMSPIFELNGEPHEPAPMKV